QGLGHTTVPLVNMAVAAVAKVGLNWVLTAIPALGILGATLATTVYMGLAAVMNLYFIHRYIGYRISLTELVKTTAAAFVMAVSIYAVYNALAVTSDSTAVMTVVSALAGSLVYTGVLFMLGMIRREDVAGVPYVGDKLTRLFCRIGVF
ncbi:MAG: polysaccharide biosynthesis C-terminal domain-containing protein, partial [Selenomonadales bacterium]|nr:polysaccharide biosynthesis C-terminal domain-containing protein [Selenomonadales bacterium]